MEYRRREPRRDWGINRGNLFFVAETLGQIQEKWVNGGYQTNHFVGMGGMIPCTKKICIVCLLKIVIVYFHHGTPP